MAKIQFRKVRFNKASLYLFNSVQSIITEYQKAGYVLTLRQLYYQLVSRDVIPNKQKEYARLSALLTNARMGGHIDWDAIEDRLRKPWSPNEFENPLEALETIIDAYGVHRMKGQETYVEVWVEKDALSGVLRRVTREYHIPIMVNRGYSSASAMYDAFNRFNDARKNKQKVRILYLGDFDPSGIDMIRDIEHRVLEFFVGIIANHYETKGEKAEAKGLWQLEAELYKDSLRKNVIDFDIIPIALTRKQIKQYNPPPNPAKTTDSRSGKFIAEHGKQSWEVDALRPEVLHKVLQDAILELIDVEVFETMKSREAKDIKKLQSLKPYL